MNCHNPLINRTDDTQQQDTCEAYDKADAGIQVAFEWVNGFVVGIDIHCFYHQQIII